MELRERILGYLNKGKRDRISRKAMEGFMRRGHGVDPFALDLELRAMIADGTLAVTNGVYWMRQRKR